MHRTQLCMEWHRACAADSNASCAAHHKSAKDARVASLNPCVEHLELTGMGAPCMPMHDSMCLSHYMQHLPACARKPQLPRCHRSHNPTWCTPAPPPSLPCLSPAPRYFLITQRGYTIHTLHAFPPHLGTSSSHSGIPPYFPCQPLLLSLGTASLHSRAPHHFSYPPFLSPLGTASSHSGVHNTSPAPPFPHT